MAMVPSDEKPTKDHLDGNKCSTAKVKSRNETVTPIFLQTSLPPINKVHEDSTELIPTIYTEYEQNTTQH